MYDWLFDRHFISYNDDGTLLISGKLNSEKLSKLNLPEDIKINVSEGMKKYLKLHREKFNLKEDQWLTELSSKQRIYYSQSIPLM